MWGCTPAELRQVTVAEYRAMVEQLTAEIEARQRATK